MLPEGCHSRAERVILHERDSHRLYESSQEIVPIYTSQQVTEPAASDLVAELRRIVLSFQVIQ